MRATDDGGNLNTALKLLKRRRRFHGLTISLILFLGLTPRLYALHLLSQVKGRLFVQSPAGSA
jgi:hypothetical protein